MNLSKSSYNNGFADLFSQICKISIYCIQVISTHENGEEKRDVYLQKAGMSITDFLQRPYSFNGIKTIPRKGTQDFYMLYLARRSKTPSSNV